MKQKGFILIPMVLIVLMIMVIGTFLFKYRVSIFKINSNSTFKTNTKQAVYYSKNKTVSFQYPSTLFTIDEFDDTPQKLYADLVSDTLLFYKTKEDATSNRDCVSQEAKTLKCEGECYSKCDDRWLLHLSISATKDKKGGISQIKKVYAASVTDDEKKYFDYIDENKRSWVTTKRNFSLNWPNSFSDNTVEIISSRANLETQNYLYEINIDTVSNMIDHDSVRNKILSTFKFVE